MIWRQNPTCFSSNEISFRALVAQCSTNVGGEHGCPLSYTILPSHPHSRCKAFFETLSSSLFGGSMKCRSVKRLLIKMSHAQNCSSPQHLCQFYGFLVDSLLADVFRCKFWNMKQDSRELQRLDWTAHRRARIERISHRQVPESSNFNHCAPRWIQLCGRCEQGLL